MESDWIAGLAGGVMIGCAAALFLLGNGRIMGISGIVGGLIDGSAKSQWRERLFFIAGLIALPAVLAFMTGGAETKMTPNLWLVVMGGILVGLGTRIGNGCTSGHGVCGISRLSRRGIVATLTFIASGAVTVLLLRLGGFL
jgi:uncharacterized membrane protein YedE/YeeE